jgi:putative transposase
MSRKYKFGNERHAHFVTFTVIHWIDFFIREEYRKILVDSIAYCQKNKGLEVHAYCIMPSHVHMVISTNGTHTLTDITRDLKGHTSRCFRAILSDEKVNYESRKSWMFWMMQRAGISNTSNKDFQFWQQDSHPIELYSDEVLYQKIDYIHMNPVVSGFVDQPEYWLYSSARDYGGGVKELIELAGN